MNANDHLPIEILSAHLDGETTAEERARVESHLAGCESCLASFEDLRRLVEASAQLGAPHLPEGLRERIASSIAPPVPRRRAWLGAAASIAAVGLVATAWYLQGPEAPAPQPPPAQVRSPEADAAPGPAGQEVERLKSLGYVGRVGKARADAAPPPPTPPETKLESEGIAAQRDAKDADAADSPAIDAETRERVEDPSLRRESMPPPAPEASAAPEPAEEPFVDRVGIACGDVEFVEVSVDVAISRRSLEDALRRQGAMPQAESQPGVLNVIVPRPVWPGCRKTLAESGIVIADARAEAVRGQCIGVTIRFPAP